MRVLHSVTLVGVGDEKGGEGAGGDDAATDLYKMCETSHYKDWNLTLTFQQGFHYELNISNVMLMVFQSDWPQTSFAHAATRSQWTYIVFCHEHEETHLLVNHMYATKYKFPFIPVETCLNINV